MAIPFRLRDEGVEGFLGYMGKLEVMVVCAALPCPSIPGKKLGSASSGLGSKIRIELFPLTTTMLPYSR
jgi:hypothetical protein